MSLFDENCAGCDISQRISCPRGGVLRLADKWLVNQYGGTEGFLGWLALQPITHYSRLEDLALEEQGELGRHLVSLDSALQSYWQSRFGKDLIEQVYFAFLHESRFDKPDPFARPSKPYHIHVHVIPRTQQMGLLMRENHDGVSIINAWQVWNLSKTVPAPYRRPEAGDWTAASELLTALKDLVPGAEFLRGPAA